METKIVFLCVDPWEGFLLPGYQSYGREYYQCITGTNLLREENSYCQERIEVYGESEGFCNTPLFSKTDDEVQILYVQSGRKEVLKEVFQKADIVMMGLPRSKKEFDKIYMTVFPWIDRIKFLWDKRICEKKTFLKELCMKYKLSESQFIEIEKPSSFEREL